MTTLRRTGHINCPLCRPEGGPTDRERDDCRLCCGRHVLERMEAIASGQVLYKIECHACNGTGEMDTDDLSHWELPVDDDGEVDEEPECEECDGFGHELIAHERLAVHVAEVQEHMDELDEQTRSA